MARKPKLPGIHVSLRKRATQAAIDSAVPVGTSKKAFILLSVAETHPELRDVVMEELK